MSTYLKKPLLLSTLMTLSIGSFSISAAEQIFTLKYTGNSGGSILGTIGIDDMYLVNPSSGSTEFNLPNSAFTSLSLTATGGVVGTFSLTDFTRIIFDTNGVTLDLSKELVGQATGGGQWGTSGDFNLFGSSLNGSSPFKLSKIGGGEAYTLTSFRLSELQAVLLTLADVQASLNSVDLGIQSTLSTVSTVVNGAHSRPMSRRVAANEKTFWLAGDWGNDDHGTRNGNVGLAEVGGGYNFGLAQINLSIGKTWADQDLIHGGEVNNDGKYLMVEGILPVSEADGIYATLGIFHHWGNVDIERGYVVMGSPNFSSADADSRTWGLRARIDWENAITVGAAKVSPYTDLSHTKTTLDSYTETGGNFPAYFDSRKDSITELRAGLNSAIPIKQSGFDFIANIEAVHRFDESGSSTSGQVVGLFDFNLKGQDYDQNWFKGGLGVEGKLGKGKALLMLNGTTEGEMTSLWLAASYQLTF